VSERQNLTEIETMGYDLFQSWIITKAFCIGGVHWFNCHLKVSIRKLFLKRETEKRVSMSDKLSSILKLIVQNNFNIVFILHLGKHLISFFMFLLHSTNFSSIERFHFFHFTSIIKMLSTVKKFRIIVPFET
jgi:hypothetical protein